MIRVLLVEDHSLVREGIRVLLEKEDNLEIIAEAHNGHQAVELAIEHRPDEILMDINMPILNGIQACQQITAMDLGLRIIMLSMYSDEALVRQALLAGAMGYVLKNSLVEELTMAIQAAMRGEAYLSPGVSKVLINGFIGNDTDFSCDNPIDLLTMRERQVMQLIAEGYKTKEIAEYLSVSQKTIEKHRASLMEKLEVRNVAAVVRLAVKYDLIMLN